jgi:hypothetical protein
MSVEHLIVAIVVVVIGLSAVFWYLRRQDV